MVDFTQHEPKRFYGRGPDWCGICGHTLKPKEPCRRCEKEISSRMRLVQTDPRFHGSVEQAMEIAYESLMNRHTRRKQANIGYHGKVRKRTTKKGTIHQSGIKLPNLRLKI